MFTNFFYELKEAKIPVTLREYLTLMEALDKGVADYKVEDFYYLSRACLVKDEKNLDKFDRVFGRCFEGIEFSADAEKIDIPEDWLKQLVEKFFSEEEKAALEAMDWDELMETLKKRMEEQKARHEGGNKWIGTSGTSPYGAYGYNPAGVRIGQKESRNQKAVKVWDKREFKNLDDSLELGTRNIKVALRRLRRWAREGNAEELDLPDTIRATAKNAGYLDLKMVPERHNNVKVLLFFDVGGSMDPHIKVCQELFSAARSEFKNMEYFYFHNCVYEEVWQDNVRRRADKLNTFQVLHTYPHDYKVIFVGDATMSPYEIVHPGGSVEHWNEESGEVWMHRVLDVYHKAVWLNPVPEGYWETSPSIRLMKQIMGHRMFPMTLAGLENAMKALSR
ncbi:VWA domain-containing protein [Emcibacter sp. SYSU 3D8]|uniref:vWA domain-containing protein n=1 Tax=Emcibacter sp. SYSU 3D8 TaxID=3133969 RepID=UPI0031FF4007